MINTNKNKRSSLIKDYFFSSILVKSFLLSAKRGEFLLNIDSKTRLRILIQATNLEREMMGEN